MSVLLGNGDGTFQTRRRYYATGNNPSSIAVGEFNGDGKPDLAVANDLDDTVSVLLGNGDGTFRIRVDYSTGKFPNSVAVGDFNGDGKPDLAVANYYDNTVSVLLGNGDGTFQARVDYSTGKFPNSVAVGDFNGDGKPDLAVANGNGTVSVLLGNGDGAFQARVDYPTGNDPVSVAVGDFNGDGKPDLAVANYLDDTVSVLLGNGDGTFQARVDYSTVNGPMSVAVGDFNGDGKLDLTVAGVGHYDPYFPPIGGIHVLLGNGDGTFQGGIVCGGYDSFSWVGVSDFNGDGKQDLAATRAFTPDVEVLLGNGDGTFPLGKVYAFPQVEGTAAVADINRDGAPDLVVATTWGVNILLNIRGTMAELRSSASPSILGQPLTLTATIRASLSDAGLGVPTGTVAFVEGTNELGRQTLGADGVATLAIGTLTTGAHSIAAIYGGDDSFNPNMTAHLTQVVNPPQDFGLSSTPDNATLRSGNSAVFTVAVTAMNGFNGAVSLTCSVSPSPAFAPKCTLNPTSITPSTSATSNLTVATIGTTASLFRPMFRRDSRLLYGLWLPISGLALLGVGIARGRSGRKKILLGILITDLLLIGLGTQTACGGGSNPIGSSGTPPGQYIVTVNALSGSIAHTTKVTLTVR